ncbi:MAG: EamA family transporter, partial [Pseudomonadota bacterium]|nr:EamA family transporter [Pseudomonadota bacterium]
MSAQPRPEMTPREGLFFTVILVVVGAGWGMTQPLSKIAVSTGHGHFGLIFWQLAIGAAILAGVSLVRGKGLPMRRDALFVCAIIALIGTVIPNSTSYQAIRHLPSGVMS